MEDKFIIWENDFKFVRTISFLWSTVFLFDLWLIFIKEGQFSNFEGQFSNFVGQFLYFIGEFPKVKY